MSNPSPLGMIKPTPGTPLLLVDNFPLLPGELANSIYIQVLDTNVGKVYIGNRNLNKAVANTVILVLPPPTITTTPDVTWEIPSYPNPFLLGDYKVDVDVLGDGVRADYIQL